MKTKRMPWEDLGIGPHGPPQATTYGTIPMTEEQRVALCDMMHHVFVDLRGLMYIEPSREFVAFVSQIGRSLHNVPTWLQEGKFSAPDDFDYVMRQYREGFGFKEPKR